MSKLAAQVMNALREEPQTIYKLMERLNRTFASIQSIMVVMRKNGYLKKINKTYPAVYALTGKSDGPVMLEWPKRAPKDEKPETMVAKTIRSTPNSVFHLGGR